VTTELEDPRKSALRTRCEEAVDAAGFTVLVDRPATPWPAATKLVGALLGDVVSEDGAGCREHYFVRVDGTKALAAWLVAATEASFAIANIRIYVVAEAPGESLIETCTAAGTGLARLTSSNRLEVVCEYGPPAHAATAAQFRSRVKAARHRLEAKLRLNERRLEESFRDSASVTADMSGAIRDSYLETIETAMIVWREWSEELSEQLDALLANEDVEELTRVEAAILGGPK